jgi:uncharacterized delta-60 repeat protein
VLGGTNVVGSTNLVGGTNQVGLGSGAGTTNLALSFNQGVLHLRATNYSTTNFLGTNFMVPSPILVYYQGVLLFQTNLIDGASFDLPFAGTASNLVLVANQGLAYGPDWRMDWVVEPTLNLTPVLSKTLIAGEFTKVGQKDRQRIALLMGDGLLDGSFYPFGDFHVVVNALGLYTNFAHPDLAGKAIVGGSFNVLVGGAPLSNYARLNLDGTLDETFHVGAGTDKPVRAVAVQADGKAIIAGTFTNVDQLSRAYLARLNANGYLDPSYNAGVGPNGGINAVALQSDNNLIIGGEFTAVYGASRNRLARMNGLTGTVDTNFFVGAGANGIVRAVAVMGDGKVLAGGDFTAMNNTPSSYLAQLTPAGAVVTSFSAGLNVNGSVSAIAVQSDGGILIGGAFTSVNGLVLTWPASAGAPAR